jgi:heat shock protein HslJ
MVTIASILLAFFAASMPLTQATPVPGEPAIPPIIWQLIEMPGDDGALIEVTEPERYTVQFLEDGTMAIGADCNRATASFTTSSNDIDITLGISTLVLCPPDSLADPFQRHLDDAETFEFDADGNLVLASEAGTLRFRPELQGVIWEWQEFEGSDDSLIAPERPESYTLTFLPDDKLAIQADCNRAKGSYTADGPAMTFMVGGVTRMACAPGSLMNQYLENLGHVSSHVFRDGRLFLALKLDSGIMEFAARQQDNPSATPVAG